MPLSPSAPRALKHVRRVNYQGFEREDGLWDIEAELHDSKAYDAPRHRGSGTRRAGEPIHHMWLRVTLDRQLVVQSIEVAMDAHPLEDCPQAQPALQRMVGCTMARGWRQSIQRHLGGVASCTHLRELLFNLATAAFQSVPLAFAPGSEDEPPRHLGQCTGWDFNGDAVKEHYPRFYGRAVPTAAKFKPNRPPALIQQALTAIIFDKPKETSMRVQNKSIIVTGAGNGIGEGIAKRLAAEGGRVIVNDIHEAGGQRVVAEITAAGGTAAFFQADVTQSAEVKAMVGEAVRLHGRLDVVVNNAGWTHRNRPMLEVSEDEFDKVYAINMKSIYLSAIHAVPAMRQGGGGSFINIASTAGLRPRPGLTWYNGSKGAVIITSKSMAAELGPDNIRVNCINPVFNPDTGLAAEFAGGPVDEARRAKFLATIPLGRFSTALDVANAALYLASDEAAFISGVCIEVDGARCV